MKPRILKKLCKRVYELAGHEFGVPFKDEEPLGDLRYDRIWNGPLHAFTAKMRRDHFNASSPISNCLMAGGGLDYWGEANEPYFLFDAAQEAMLWEFGDSVTREVKLDDGTVVDEVPDWPRYSKRLNGKEVIRLLKMRSASPSRHPAVR